MRFPAGNRRLATLNAKHFDEDNGVSYWADKIPCGNGVRPQVRERRLVVFASRKRYLPPQPTKQMSRHSRRESLATAIYCISLKEFPSFGTPFAAKISCKFQKIATIRS